MTAPPTIGISISDSPDLARLGFRPAHVASAVVEIVTQLGAAMFQVGYGGDLRPGGFTNKIFRTAAETYGASKIATADPPIVHYVPGVVWRPWTAARLIDHLHALAGTGEVILILDAMHGVSLHLKDTTRSTETDFVKSTQKIAVQVRHPRHADVAVATAMKQWCGRIGATPPAEPVKVPIPPRDIDENTVDVLLADMRHAIATQDPSDSLTQARQFMAMDSGIRIVLGGKTADYGGHAPGIAEEALYALIAGRPVIALGTFGGAALGVRQALTGFLPDDLATWGMGSQQVLQSLKRTHRPLAQTFNDVGATTEIARLHTEDNLRQLAILVRRIVANLTSRYDAPVLATNVQSALDL